LDAGARARDLVQQILTFSRKDDAEQKPVKVAAVVEEALKLIRASFPSTISIDLKVASQATVLADPTQIHQIVMNLCTNARHVMRETGGTLTVRVDDVLLTDDAPNPGELPAGRYVRLEVSDSGPGIPDAIITNIFDPFFTTKKEGEGTGLGLSVVHGIVQNCGGTITAANAAAGGAVFVIHLPAITRPTTETGRTEAELPRGSERIMVVDDEPYQVDVAKQILELLGYQVRPFTASLEALEAFRQAPQDVDLVLTDTTMPQMTGDVLGKAMLAIRPDLPIVICTGYTERLNPAKARQAGFRDFLMKPLIMKELAQTIRRVLDASPGE
jgi:CheY-like chemotaxis protein